jgi:hypothetical protein
MKSYTRIVTLLQIRQKTWPPWDFENSDWSIFKNQTPEPLKGFE